MNFRTHSQFAFALLILASSSAVAQTDFGSPVGAGGGLGASVAPLGVPRGPVTGGRAVSASALANARAAFVNATGGGVTVSTPAGGTVTVPVPAAQALGAVLGGSPTPAQQQALTAALGGGTTNGALVAALQVLGSTMSAGARQDAVRAYNAAILATPAGQTPSATMVAVRSVLAGL